MVLLKLDQHCLEFLVILALELLVAYILGQTFVQQRLQLIFVQIVQHRRFHIAVVRLTVRIVTIISVHFRIIAFHSAATRSSSRHRQTAVRLQIRVAGVVFVIVARRSSTCRFAVHTVHVVIVVVVAVHLVQHIELTQLCVHFHALRMTEILMQIDVAVDGCVLGRRRRWRLR